MMASLYCGAAWKMTSILTVKLLLLVVVSKAEVCDFRFQDQCGDICIHHRQYCHCGQEVFNIRVSTNKKYCCVADGGWMCYKDRNGDGRCPQGIVMTRDQPCRGQCYNDYRLRNVTVVGQRAGYLCEDQERCMEVSDMCKGYSCGPDNVEECDDSLQCIDPQFNTNKTLLVTPSISGHNYCQRSDLYLNNGEYDYVDRSDETRLATQSDTRTQLPYFPPCTMQDPPHNPGIQCQNPNLAHIQEFGEEECTESHFWCHVDQAETCLCGALGSQYSMHDRRLCGNPTLWRHISCDLMHLGQVVGHGRRCSGAMQHCYYPWYVYTRYPRPQFKLQCDDKSDQVHHVNTTCNITNYLNHHNQQFCSHEHMQDSLICTDPEQWMKNVTNPIITDPHNCQDSCQEPGPGCQACTNPDYFHCLRSGLCIHPDLHCDGHPQCQDAEDEQFDECYHQYLAKGIVEKYATYKCRSAIYPDMITIATVCDGIKECEDGSDEDSLCTDSHYLTYFLIISFLLIAATYLTLRYCLAAPEDTDLKEDIEVDFEEDVFMKYFGDSHCDNEVVEQVNAMLVNIKFTKKRSDIAEAAREFLNSELQFHDNDESEMFCCIRNQIDPSVCDILFPGVVQRIVDKIEKQFECSKISNFMFNLKTNLKFHRFYFNVRKILSIELYYADLIKDIFLTLSILKVIGGPATILNFPTKLTSVIVRLMVVTILFPLLLSGLHLAITSPRTILPTTSSKGRAQKLRLQVGIFISSIFCPFLLQNAYETSQEKLRKLARRKSNAQLINEQLAITRNLKSQFAEFMRIELGLEMFYQVTLQIVLVLLSRTNTATTGGLQTMFENTSAFGFSAEAILNLSIAWSLRSCVYLFLKTKAIEKGFLPGTTKLVALLWALAAILKRVLSMVAFFIPSMGLMDLLYHWKAEQIPFKIRRDYNVTTLQVYNLSTSENILWSEIDRWDYSDPKFSKPPSYSLYTGLELNATFLMFLAIMTLHFCIVFFVKIENGYGFQDLAPISKFIHVLENINFAFNVKDWDDGKCSKLEYKDNFKKAQQEMLLTFTVNTIFSFICLIPLWFTDVNIQARHKFIKELLGSKPEEDISAACSSHITISITLSMILLSVAEAFFHHLYSSKFHPWIKIIDGHIVKKDKGMNIEEATESISEVTRPDTNDPDGPEDNKLQPVDEQDLEKFELNDLVVLNIGDRIDNNVKQ